MKTLGMTLFSLFIFTACSDDPKASDSDQGAQNDQMLVDLVALNDSSAQVDTLLAEGINCGSTVCSFDHYCCKKGDRLSCVEDNSSCDIWADCDSDADCPNEYSCCVMASNYRCTPNVMMCSFKACADSEDCIAGMVCCPTTWNSSFKECQYGNSCN